VVFFVLNTGVEVILVLKLKKELKEKKKRLDQMEMTSGAVLSSKQTGTVAVVSFRKLRKQNIEAGAEGRAVLMVTLNAILNFFFRLPELLSVFSVAQNIFGCFSFVYVFSSLPIFLTDLAYFFYILTSTTTFFIFYLFNLKFKETFTKYTNAKKRL
jgi:hypothetical protein